MWIEFFFEKTKVLLSALFLLCESRQEKESVLQLTNYMVLTRTTIKFLEDWQDVRLD